MNSARRRRRRHLGLLRSEIVSTLDVVKVGEAESLLSGETVLWVVHSQELEGKGERWNTVEHFAPT